MKPARLVAMLSLALALLLLPALNVAAQDATPEGTPAAACVAPELSVAATPVAATGDVDDAPVREGPASRNIGQAAVDALDNLVACADAGDLGAVVALLTPNMWEFISGSQNPEDVIAAFFEQMPAPVTVYSTSSPVIDTNNRIGLTVVYSGLYTPAGVQVPEKWYFVRDGDHLLLDEVRSTTMPVDLYPDATVLDVQMIDFGFALDANSVPAGPVLFHFSNTSFSGATHCAGLGTFPEGMTAEQIILSDPDTDESTGYIYGISVEAGQQADFYVEDLAPATYSMLCALETDNGVRAWQLGMVAQFTVE